jgi:hypothetical protein
MLALLALALLSAAPDVPDDGWKLLVDGDVKVFSRQKPGARVLEMKAEMLMPATPREVRDVLMDEEYSKRTPWVAENRLIDRPTPNSKVKYTRLAFPIIQDRDYFITVTCEQDLAEDGSGLYHSSWKPWGLDRPARDGVVRVTTCEGYWDVRPDGDGHASHVTYYLLSDPGGNIPAFAVNLGNKRVLPELMHGLLDEVVRRRGSGGR